MFFWIHGYNDGFCDVFLSWASEHISTFAVLDTDEKLALIRSHDFSDYVLRGQRQLMTPTLSTNVVLRSWSRIIYESGLKNVLLWPKMFPHYVEIDICLQFCYPNEWCFKLFLQLDILRGIHADLATLANEVNHLLGFQGGHCWFTLPREIFWSTFN